MPKKSVCIGLGRRPGKRTISEAESGLASSVGLTVEPHVGGTTHDDILIAPN